MVLEREKKQLVLWVGIMVVVLCICSLLWSRPAAAAGSIELQMEVGYDGKIKEGQWFPVKFTVTNPSEDVSGDLVVQVANPMGGNDATYIKHLDLPKQTTKVVWMSLPGMSYNGNNNVIKFYKGDISKGEIVPISKGNDYITATPTQSVQVGVLARDPDTLNFLSLLQSKNIPVSVIHLKPEQLPGESVMLDGLDVLALNDFASDQLKEDQVKAITSWVNRGGTLVLAGGAGYPKTAKAFEGLSPVTYTGTASVPSLSSLEQASGKELKLSEPFTVSTSALRAGEVITQEKQQPLFVKKSTGSGEVWYVAYDLALNPVASWNGSPELWEKVIQGHSGPTNMKRGRPGYSFMNQFSEVQYALDFFPSLVSPSFFMLLIVFLIYVVLVAPFLYLLLKKVDKREWAWIIIPAFSILSSAVIFMIGSSDKSSTLIHTLNTLELNGSGQGQRTSATAVFVPRGGSYELEVPKAAHTVLANTNQGFGSNGQLTGISDQHIRLDAEKTRIGWSDVPYWSVRKAWIQNDEIEQLGKFDVNLTLDSNGLKGEIANATKSDLNDVNIIINRSVYSVGELKVGEKKPVALTSPTNVNNGNFDFGYLLFSNPNGMNGGMVYRNGNGNMDNHERERQMINSYMNNSSKGMNQGKPVVIGWSKDKQSLFKVNGKDANTDQLNLWVQAVDFQVVQGDKISIPAGYITPVIVNNNTNQLFMEPNGTVVIGNGSVTFEYALPRIQGASYTKLDLRMPGGAGIPQFLILELWNGEKQDWEPIDLRVPVEKKDNLSAYILDGGTTIRMKATATQQFGFQFPEVALEGTVRR
ncbi:hypothetical protein GC093_26210 [Paenibacillus sp. LMG 31456]|uniref:DUF7408 domain-containing protein n=1 Tax=Paenibacillus foliorum TaxID=2654974 RepID=A0A972GTP7_9BACL|nr:hypothetical protein [Paenibacillus foliorum]NOU96686.1 hypothetical protein [Paenibacillus foliorum]